MIKGGTAAGGNIDSYVHACVFSSLRRYKEKHSDDTDILSIAKEPIDLQLHVYPDDVSSLLRQISMKFA